MSYVHDHISTWSKMSFAENPYDRALPDWILRDNRIMAVNKYTKSKPKKQLCDFNQNGNVTLVVINDSTKTIDWETEETISYSKIFRDLLDRKKLCPSNFAANVIDSLYKWDQNHNMMHSQDFYIGTVARGCRAFASLMREQHLTEIVDSFMRVEAKKRGKKYRLWKTTVREDMKMKTDIIFKYDGEFYRLWSYQTTESGIDRTSKRVMKACGKGYNILVPFNDDEKVPEEGWWLYNKDVVQKILTKFVLDRDFEVMSHEEYKKLVEADKNIIMKPAIFKI